MVVGITWIKMETRGREGTQFKDCSTCTKGEIENLKSNLKIMLLLLSGDDDGGLVVVPGSQLLFESTFQNFPELPKESDYVRFPSMFSA